MVPRTRRQSKRPPSPPPFCPPPFCPPPFCPPPSRLRAFASRIAWAVVALLVVVLGTSIARWLVRGAKTVEPAIPHRPPAATSDDMQAVCNAHGRLRMLAKYPQDHITAFELLDLDPGKRPFLPPEKSRWPANGWYQEVKQMVDKRHTELLEQASHQGDYGEGLNKNYAAAVTISANPAAGGRSPARAIQGKDRACVWPHVQEFYRELCRDTWPSTGMAALGKDDTLFNKACL
ncbi:uncharacterized protein C8A04DRAFT_31699 [Dichotomopilus funicola]|uniref:Uncharacterized protein n=1 Tax=Dichotomopilus funicola TaxID=1934379 RepID=A0AAN6ZJG6_9PEZI|nr:hypothetical protein C8A04DRAFT_31699 [Dichotomopilus funicola]